MSKISSFRQLDNFKQKVVRGFAWESGTRFVVQIASWISTIWVARILVPDDYGIVAISGIFTGLGLKVAGMGLGSALVNRKIMKTVHASNAFWVGSMFAIVIYLILYAAAPIIASHFKIPGLSDVVRIAAILIVLSSLGIVPRALAMRKLLFKEAALISMTSGGVLTGMTLVMALLGFGYWSLIISTVVAEGIIVVAFWYLVRYWPQRPRTLVTVLPYLRYGVKVTSSGVLDFVNSQWAILIASSTLGQTVTGYLEMARVLGAMPMEKIGQIFASIAFPAFSRIQSDISRTKSVFLRIHAVLYIVTLPMFLGLAVVADDLVPLLLGEQWTPIVIPIQLICSINVFAIGTQIMSKVLNGLARPDLCLKFQLILLLVMPASLAIGAGWGLNGLLAASALTFPIGYIYLAMRLTALVDSNLREMFQTLLPAVKSSLVMVGSVLLVNSMIPVSSVENLVVLVLIQIVVGALAYSISISVLDRRRFKEVLSLVRR